jgi:hypothetical protein
MGAIAIVGRQQCVLCETTGRVLRRDDSFWAPHARLAHLQLLVKVRLILSDGSVLTLLFLRDELHVLVVRRHAQTKGLGKVPETARELLDRCQRRSK